MCVPSVGPTNVSGATCQDLQLQGSGVDSGTLSLDADLLIQATELLPRAPGLSGTLQTKEESPDSRTNGALSHTCRHQPGSRIQPLPQPPHFHPGLQLRVKRRKSVTFP
jgi:hypothetical protein